MGGPGAHLLFANAGEVPDHEAPVCTTGGQNGLILGAPADLENLLRVVVEGVQRLAQVAQIVQRHLALQQLPCQQTATDLA